MMRRLILLLSCIVPLLAACSKEQISSRPCDFDIKITELKGTKIRYTVTPSNPEAYYVCRLVAEFDEEYRLSGKQLVDSEMETLKQMYSFFVDFGRQTHNFSDAFCFRGRTEQVEMYLTRNMAYKLVIFQVNPWKVEALGEPEEVYFQTVNSRVIDLDFDLEFSGDTLRIHPSLPGQTYIWDYEERDIIEAEYASPLVYFYSLLDMYEQYGFSDSVVNKGDDEWVFPSDDAAMPAGKEWYLILAGYQDGDINSGETLVRFTWSPGASAITERIMP